MLYHCIGRYIIYIIKNFKKLFHNIYADIIDYSSPPTGLLLEIHINPHGLIDFYFKILKK